MTLHLASRSWPQSLMVLRDRFPRERWTPEQGLGELALFWLQKHRSLSTLGDHLVEQVLGLQDGRLGVDGLRTSMVAPLSAFLQSLEGHHHVEDNHYFPIFRKADARLSDGFSILERDHDLLHRQVGLVVAAANLLLRQPGATSDAARRYADAIDVLVTGVKAHLHDEEDLIIPLLAQRTALLSGV